jgi:hypothetical protein
MAREEIEGELCATRAALSGQLTRQSTRTRRSWSSQAVMEERQTVGEGQRSGISAIRMQGRRIQRDAETLRVRDEVDEQMLLEIVAGGRATR